VTQTILEEKAMKSRHRVKSYGEVFTPSHMVTQMLDLACEGMESRSDFVDKTFFEPAAGDGNFLVAILQRKLSAVTRHSRPERIPEESLFALSSIYGIELLEDNHLDAKNSMLLEFAAFHETLAIPCDSRTNLRRAAEFLIETNIICGNTLTGLDLRGEEIQFSWWSRVAEETGIVQREPFTFLSLRHGSLDFVQDSYDACPIDRVHKEEMKRA
jgi:hypothetical protein